MEIQSAFNSGVQGFQKASEDATKAASDIVVSTVLAPQAAADANINQASASQNTQATTQLNNQTQPELTQSLINLTVAEYQAKGSAEVIKTADEALGLLLDVRA